MIIFRLTNNKVKDFTRCFLVLWQDEITYFAKTPPGCGFPDEFHEYPKSEFSLEILKVSEVSRKS